MKEKSSYFLGFKHIFIYVIVDLLVGGVSVGGPMKLYYYTYLFLGLECRARKLLSRL